MKKLSNTLSKEKISILIPTYKRPQYIQRAVDYWRNMDVNLFIADSTPQGNQDLNDIENYYHLPKLNFAQKVDHVLKKIMTPFVALSADDDFISETGLNESIKYLEEHTDYVSTQGRYIAFWINDSDTIDYCPRYVEAKDKEVFHVEAKERMKIALSPYMHQIYAVHKTDVIKKAFKVSNEFFDPLVMELNTALVPSIFGNFKTLPIFYGAREAMDPKNYIGYLPSFREWYSASSSKADLSTWRNGVASIYSEQEKTDKEEGFLAFDNAITDHLHQPTENPYVANSLSTKIKKILKEYIPHSIIDLYREVRYGGLTWPPQPLHAKKMRERYLNEKGYPHSEKTAQIEWERIKNVIEKYGVLDGVTRRDFTAEK